MEFLSQYATEPTAQFLRLLELLAVLVYTVHLPYAGIVIGAVSLSMWLSFRNHEVPDERFDRLAGDLIDVFLGNKIAMLVLGVLPLLVLPFLYAQWFAGLEATPMVYIPWVIPMVLVGYFIVTRFRGSFAQRRIRHHRHMLTGTVAVAVLGLSYFVLLRSVTRLHDPEKWFRVKNLAVMLLNWNVIWKFAFFIHAGLALTGAAILFFFLRWRQDEPRMDAQYADFVKKFGGGVSLAFTFALPVFYVFYIYTTPDVAFNSTVYVLAAAVSGVSLFIALFLLGVLSSPKARFGSVVFSLFIVVFVLSGCVDLIAMNQANREHYRLVEREGDKARQIREAELHALLEGGSSAGTGEQVFERVCAACHRMDERLVGPPLASVLPGYVGDVEALVGFVGNPAKKNPDYPPMPNPGLSPSETRAVAEYLLGLLAAPDEGL